MAADSRLAEEDPPTRVELVQDRDERERRGAEEQAEHRSGDVEAALEHERRTGQTEMPDAEQHHSIDVVHLDRGPDDVQDARQKAHRHARRLTNSSMCWGARLDGARQDDERQRHERRETKAVVEAERVCVVG